MGGVSANPRVERSPGSRARSRYVANLCKFIVSRFVFSRAARAKTCGKPQFESWNCRGSHYIPAHGLAPDTVSDDIYRYRWEGKLQAAGGNPYESRPVDPRWASLRDSTFPLIAGRDFKAIYGPLSQQIELRTYCAAAAVEKDPARQVFWFKLPFALCDCAPPAARARADLRLVAFAGDRILGHRPQRFGDCSAHYARAACRRERALDLGLRRALSCRSCQNMAGSAVPDLHRMAPEPAAALVSVVGDAFPSSALSRFLIGPMSLRICAS